ncbi:SRPBCC family protein [Spongisporangium articulatum]|uniref:SRPBCC family protein n=1 Tax=Spongisporangium articulatum TaxID=3362603 RepID=A0ABW8ANW5_9ACTN
MVTVERTFVVLKPRDVVLDYLKDFAHAEEWDPGTKYCRRNDSGPVAVGSTWHNVSEFNGSETELEYRLETLEPGRLTFVGNNKTATSTDDITLVDNETGTTITYRANIAFHGIAKLAGPFLQRTFEKLADETREQMTRTINALE